MLVRNWLRQMEKSKGMFRHLSTSLPQSTEEEKNAKSFDFSVANYEKVEKILSRYPDNYKASAIIPLLDLAQRQHANGFLSVAAMKKVARITGVKDIQVFEVASFYTMFNRNTPNGKFFIQLCGTTPCMICGSQEIKETIQKHLGLANDHQEHTPDGLFTLREVECLGACSNAPMVQINDDFYENLTPETTVQLLEYIKKHGEGPPMNKWGSLPMNGQLSCEGPQGKTTLKWDKPNGPGFGMRPDSDLQPKIDPKQIKEEMLY